MKDEEITTKRLSDWKPETDPVRVKVLGKKVEEMGELLTVIGRCLIQGVDKHNPETGQLNKEWLEDEIANNDAFSELIVQVFDLDADHITARTAAKVESKTPWVMGTATDLLPDSKELNRKDHPVGTVVELVPKALFGRNQSPLFSPTIVKIAEWNTSLVDQQDVSFYAWNDEEPSPRLWYESHAWVVTNIIVTGDS